MLFGMRFNPAEGGFGTAGKYFRGSQRGNTDGPGSQAGPSSSNNGPGNNNSTDGRGARQTNRSDSRCGGSLS